MPEGRQVTLVVDGVEVAAPEGQMLVDAAQGGDIEIPVFCYDPKLGDPVGACRMCMVEVEGIPKLQTACSTPVRDGMVVHTRTERVHEAQNAVVEFLLINHPLDCPVCDKGGECPLQDIAMGWGPGRSRMVDPKRHFQKPIPLSPLVKIDRERCILCYRCVRFSQEVSEDAQLQLLERGDRSFVGTFDNRPYVAPFHGNIIELCPVGALTSQAYRFRARPWEIEDAGSVCTLCPAQCNISFTVRDERVMRVLGRDNAEVDDGWLCDKGRFGYQMIGSEDRIRAPRIRAGGEQRQASWAEALETIASGLRAAGPRTAALVGGGSSNEEGYLAQRILRRALGSPHVDSPPGGALGRAARLALTRPELAARTADIDRAGAVLVLGCDPMHEMPILELRIRKAARRSGTRLLVASERPTALDGGTPVDVHGVTEAIRYAPGDGPALIGALLAALDGAAGEAGDAGSGTSSDAGAGAVGDRAASPDAPPWAASPGARPSAAGPGDDRYRNEAEALATALREAGDVVVAYGERLVAGPGGEAAAEGLVALAEALGIAEREGSGLLEVPVQPNGRGLREVGCLPDAGPGLAEAETGMDAAAIRAAIESGELRALVLWDVDPIRDLEDAEGWARALAAADLVVSVSAFASASAAHADVHLPAETHAEKEGTVTHPDGRLQRLRPGIPHPGEVRPLWQALAELAARLDHETGFQSPAEVLAGLSAEVPFYAGITPEEIGGGGVRWQEREAASAIEAAPRWSAPPVAAVPDGAGEGRVRLGTYRDLWADPATDRNPALEFLRPAQTLELAPADAERLGVETGEEVEVRSNGRGLRARVAVRERMREGAGFLIEGVAAESANLLGGGAVIEVRK